MRAIVPLLSLGCLLARLDAGASHYVSSDGSNEYPYDTWEKAAHSIQDAIDAETPTRVFVAAGRYIENLVVPEGTSVYGAGAASCTIQGVPPGHPYWSSVVFMDAGALLSGFSVHAEGCWDGVICRGGEVSDCMVIGARSFGVGAESAFVHGCAVLGNTSHGIGVSGVSVVYDTVVSGSSTGVSYTGDAGYCILLHCTVSGNRTGVVEWDLMALTVRDSIVWGNGVTDIGWLSLPDVVGCDTGDLRFAGVNGNISADPLLVGWGDFNTSDNPLHVDCSNTGEQDGTKDKPFRTIGAALRAYDFHLAAGSPCINAASDGLNIGAYPYDVPTRERSPSVLIEVAPGTYNEGDLMLPDRTHLRAAPQAQATISPPQYGTALWLNGNSWIDGFSIGVNLGTAAVCAPGSNPLITRCRIFPYALHEYSAAVRAWAPDARPMIIGCVVEGFETGIAASAIVEGCTLVDNKTAVLAPQGGGPPEIRNSVIWPPASGSAPALIGLPSANVSYSLVPDPTLHGIDGNIFADPRLADPGSGDFRLRPDSPGIDAGNSASPYLPEFDIAGMHRIMFGGKSLTVDMGAYEFYINKLEPVPGTDEAMFTWSSLADKTYSIFYTDDLFNWHVAIESLPSSGSTTTSWLDDGSLTGLAPLLAPKRFYRILENP